jgi:hypothetical protein
MKEPTDVMNASAIMETESEREKRLREELKEYKKKKPKTWYLT